jgi:hypothetical protein
VTAGEREALRVAIDARRREAVVVATAVCEFCGGELSGLQRRFCSDRHRKNYWQRYADAGRRYVAARNVRRSEARRAAA